MVVITGGTEVGHSGGTYSHSTGWKLDIRLDTCVNNYITSTFTYKGVRGDGAALYEDADGYIWAKEGNHWDILFHE